MKKDKLFHLFYSLTPKEVKAFKTFVIGRKPDKISHLVEILAKIKKEEEEKSYEKVREKAFKKLFPNDKNNTQNFRRLVTDSLHLLNDFLILQETKAKPELRQAILREQYKERTLSDLFETSLGDSMNKLKDSPERDFPYYDHNVKLQNEIIYYSRAPKEGMKKFEKNLLEVDEALDLYYCIAKLHYMCQLKMRHNVFNLLVDAPTLSNEFNALIRLYADHPVVSLYANILQITDHPSEEGYYRLKSQWIEKFKLLSDNLNLQAFTTLINLGWISVPSGKRIQVLYDLYQFAIQEKILVNSGYIDMGKFNNMIEIGVSLKEFDAVRTFIKEHISFLRVGQDQMKNVQHLYESLLLFGEGKFEDAHLKSNYLQFSHYSFGLRSYVLVMKCLYEIKKEDSLQELETRSTAFKQYLHRKHKEGIINKQKYTENMNFTKIVKLLPLTSAGKFATISPDQLLEKINGMTHLISRAWLLEKIEALR